MKKIFTLILALPTFILVKSQVIFRYDEAGNQIVRGMEGVDRNTNQTPNIITKDVKNTETLANQVANKIKVAPVPVKTDLNVFWEQDIKDYITKIELLPYNSVKIIESRTLTSNNFSNSCVFNMSKLTYGVYFLKFYLKDNSIYSVTVTKK